MSGDESPEAVAEESMQDAGGLGEVVPEPLMPAYRQLEKVQRFRETYGERYTNALELLTGLLLIVGFVWWLVLYL
ncbi:hypothetical protein [Halolamina rubra]|uniref:hypothetical protein n=1 Tax=Halolamina rubra TaxID=1380430 RepID=UPI000679BF03|nr:hypothetical protein [Halolamina rubra]